MPSETSQDKRRPLGWSATTAATWLTVVASATACSASSGSRSSTVSDRCVAVTGLSVASRHGIDAGPFGTDAIAGWAATSDGGYKFWVASHDDLPQDAVATVVISTSTGTVRQTRPRAHTPDYRSFFPGAAHLDAGDHTITVRLGGRSACFSLTLSR